LTTYGVDRDGPGIGSSANIPPLLSNGEQALTADWDAGSFEIRAQTFESDVATGTAPFVVASTTKVANLNADLLDDQSGAYYLDSANFTGTNWTDLTDAGATTLHKHDHGGQDGLTDDDHTQYVLLIGRAGGTVVKGGTAASETFTLRGTSHATKGNILLNDEGGNVIIGGGTTASELRFLEPSGSGTNYTGFKAQAQAASVTYILPAADASVDGYALKSDGSGNLSWGPAGGTETKRTVTQAGHGFAAGDVVYISGEDTYALADASAASTAEVVGIVESVPDTDTFVLLTSGYISTLSGLTAGTVYFLSTTAGEYTATEPSTVGEVSKPLFVAVSATEAYFVNMRGSVVGTASSTLLVERFSGDGSDTTFTLGSSPLEENTFVMVEGVYQQKNTYSISGTTLTFTTAPPSGTDNIEVVTVGSVNIGTPSDNTVSTAKIVDAAVTNAKIATGALFTLSSEQATTSGTEVDVTGIPSGVQMVVVQLEGVSTNGVSGFGLQIGDSGGIETTGYLSGAGGLTVAPAGFAGGATGSFLLVTGFTSAAWAAHGQIILTLKDAANNTWVCSGCLYIDDTADYIVYFAGSKSLSGALDRIRVMNGASDTFDAGSISILYR
jgi:hypothetical protein